MICHVRHELFRKGSPLNYYNQMWISCVFEFKANISKMLSSDVHLLLVALCPANGVGLKIVNLWRSSCPPTNISLSSSLTLPAPMTSSSLPRHSLEPSDLPLQQLADSPKAKLVLMILETWLIGLLKFEELFKYQADNTFLLNFPPSISSFWAGTKIRLLTCSDLWNDM